jgi:hypothetical protein
MIAALIYYCIDLREMWLGQFDKVEILAVVVVVHPPNLGLIKEGFGRISQPNLWVLAKRASQSTCQEVTNYTSATALCPLLP